MFWLALAGAAIFCITYFYLPGEDLRAYDAIVGERFDLGDHSAKERTEVELALANGPRSINPKSQKERVRLMREYMDAIPDTQEIDAHITPVDVDGISAEWVLAPGVDPSRRFLYIHGGAFMMGSPKSHRNITSAFSRVANAAVLAIDYRLMPENPRLAGVKDCRHAYTWLLSNGPDSPDNPLPLNPAAIFVAGDSAGGNLALMLIQWIRDQGLRQVDAAVALSPVTDATFSAPSLQTNLASDTMLGPMFEKVLRVPRPLLLWAGLIQNRSSPSDPVISPVYGDLAGLPPTLLHASETEVLFDDSQRYVNKAAAAGSPVHLQAWNNMPHVWHMFYPQLPEARAAWQAIEQFFSELPSTIKNNAEEADGPDKAKAAA
ncbi:MAG: alpha/beta hydrolase [Halioglobus sp.]